MESVSGSRGPYVIRTEKRKAIDADGKPFRHGKPGWSECHGSPGTNPQRLLYEAVTDYVQEGYNQALREKASHRLSDDPMQRLVVSAPGQLRQRWSGALKC